jgi:Icc-related predicted phosphoesterase
MKIGIVSDLHLEGGARTLFCEEGIDVLVFAGDIHTRPKGAQEFFQKLRAEGLDCPFIYVLGNHEYYNQVFPDILDNYRNQVEKVKDVVLLEKEDTCIKGVRFVGTTMWTNLFNETHARAAQYAMYDFRKIRLENGGIFSPRDATVEYGKSREGLWSILDEPWGGPTVVVTHHVPLMELVPEQFKDSPLSPAFSVDMSDLISVFEPDAWIYGHDHVSQDKTIVWNTRFVSNQAGYLHEGKKEVALKIIEVK